MTSAKKIGLFTCIAVVAGNMMGSGIALLPASLAKIAMEPILGGDQRHQLWRVCRYWCASGRPGSHLFIVEQVCGRSAYRGESGRHCEGESAGSGSSA